MKRFAVFTMFLCVVMASVKAQWGCSIYGGVAMPVMASDNAPAMRASLATGLRGGYLFDRWVAVGEVWHVRQLQEDNPDVWSMPMDTAFHVKRYQMIPILMGVGYMFPLSDRVHGTLYASVGGYFRYIHCQKQTSLQTLDDMGESGWGFACKLTAEMSLWERLNLQAWLMVMGNPFEDEKGNLPASKDVTYNRSHWYLKGYRQGFCGIAVGYSF